MDSEIVRFKDGTHRTQFPRDTLALIRPHMAAMGITRVADVTGLDTIGIPVVMVCRPNSRSVSVSQGKGACLDSAKVSGLMESIENFHAENIMRPLYMASLNEMKNMADTVEADRLPLIKGSPFHPDYPIMWIESQNLLNDESPWLPYEMVHTDFCEPRPMGSGCFPSCTNGLASGNTLNEATVHGICEIIERDAISLWHQMGSSDLDRTSINLTTIDSTVCQKTLNKLSDAGQSVYVWDITSDTEVPTYFCVIVNMSVQQQHIGVGSGTHLSREIALLRAMHEAVQVRTTYISGARDDLRADEYALNGIASKRGYFHSIIERCNFSSDYRQTMDIHTESVVADLEILLRNLQRLDISTVLRIDLSKPEFNIPVVRIVIPELEPPHDELTYLPGPRARRMRQESPR